MTPVYKEKETCEDHRRDGTKLQQVTWHNTREYYDVNKFSESSHGENKFLNTNMKYFPNILFS
jgi:hypothetical protein